MVRTCGLHALSYISGVDIETLFLEIEPISEDDRRISHASTWKYLESLGYALSFKLDINSVKRHFNFDPRYSKNYWRWLAGAQNVQNGCFLADTGTWPPAPFASKHFCTVQEYGQACNHAVVLNADGSVFDHLRNELVELSAYEFVHLIVGLQK